MNDILNGNWKRYGNTIFVIPKKRMVIGDVKFIYDPERNVWVKKKQKENSN